MTPIFVFWWNGIDRFGIAEKLLCFVQTRPKTWDGIAGNQIAEGKDQAINSKDGEDKAESVKYEHLDRKGRVRTAKWISGTEW
jgi:hypothetical protein